MRKKIDYVKRKIDQTLETILALARREYKICNATAVRNDVLVQGPSPYSRLAVPVPNPVIYGPPQWFTPLFDEVTSQPVHTPRVTDGVVMQGPPVINQIPISRTNEELQDKYEMENYHGVTQVFNLVASQDSKVIQMCRALEKNWGSLRGITQQTWVL